MKSTLVILLTLLSFHVKGQTKIFEGKVVDEFDLEPLPLVVVQTPDGVQLDTTDINGFFKIEVPVATNQLRLRAVSMEPTSIRLAPDCGKLEIIMMSDGTYDFMALHRVNYKRYKRFRKLPEKHKQAYTKGAFTSERPCIIYTFQKY